MSTRWQGRDDVPRGDDYDRRWQRLAAQGANIHGEADLVSDLLAAEGGTRVLDAGCGTGRVAIELARRGYTVAGVDADDRMLATARDKGPGLRWAHADLSALGDTAISGVTDTVFDIALLAGNVMIFVTPGTEAAVLRRLTDRLAPGGLLVAGFSLQPGRLGLADYDRFARDAGLILRERWATWDRQPFTGGDYAVSVHHH